MPAHAWSALLFDLDSDSSERVGDTELRAPIERFLDRRDAFNHLRTSNKIAVDYSDEVRAILLRTKHQRELFEAACRGEATRYTEAEVAERLATTTFTRELKPFQLTNVTKLYNLIEAGADFSVPGAGKTTTALAVHSLFKQEATVDRLLVVAPLSAFEAWEDECVKCFSKPLRLRKFTKRDGSEDVVLIHYQVLAQQYDALSTYCQSHKVHLVLDEAHRMKRGRSGQWGRACIDLAFLAERRDILTGTPAPQSAKDLDALLAAMWPAAGTGLIPNDARSINATQDSLRIVANRIRPLFVRTTKKSLDLPEPDVKTVPVALDSVQAEIYEGLRQRWRDAAQSGPIEMQVRQLGMVMTYLQMAALHPGLLRKALEDTPTHRLQWPLSELPADATLIDKINTYGAFEHPAKYDKLRAMVKENADRGRKTLVWSTFVDSVNTIGNQVLAPFQPAVVHGSTPIDGEDDDPALRKNQIRRFRHDPNCSVLVANPAAMSEGVSLHHECHEAIYVDRSFNAGQFLQSVDRIHRLGLDPNEHTRIRILTCRGTIDEVVATRLEIKTTALGLMLDDPELALLQFTDEDDTDYTLDAQDREALVQHLRR